MIGNVLNIISERGLYCDDLPYELTKCALIDFTKGLSQKVIKNEIRVNAIAPGVTATKMTGYKEDENLYNEYTCGRGFLYLEIAQIAVFSISDYFDCISGEVLSCNQGNHLSQIMIKRINSKYIALPKAVKASFGSFFASMLFKKVFRP